MNKLQSSLNQTGALQRSSMDNVVAARINSDRGGGIDTHPYQRGSVIEIIYGAGKVEDSDVEEDFNEEDDDGSENSLTLSSGSIQLGFKKATKILTTTTENDKKVVHEIRLADIIDRCQSDTPNHENPAYRYKYYIHYRGYNRRMDEWISDPQRILSPPSVGNAKVREMKKAKIKAAKEEEEKKYLERAAEAQLQNAGSSDEATKRRKLAAVASDPHTVSPGGRATIQRASSRRAIAAITSSNTMPSSENNIPTTSESKREDLSLNQGNYHSAAPGDENEQLRLTRRQRRKSGRGANNVDDNNTKKHEKISPLPAALSGSSLVTTLLPGKENIQDKVVTVAARELDEHEGLDEASLREHEEVTKVKNVGEVQLGRYRMNAWYFSPIPKEMISNGTTVDVLYVCEFTLNFFSRREELLRFQAKDLPRNKRHPPGNEIYRNGNLSMFEIDGYEERLYCQNLCFIAKLFLDHKTLYFDVDPFLFYVLCEVDSRGFHPVGYYSKEKYSDVGFNLACILTFPCHQRKGYGRFLIDFSYELSKKEEKVGSPEKPMSDLGQQAYKPYWTSTIVDFLLNQSNQGSISIMEISKKTSIMAEDIIFTLNLLGLLKYINGVYFIAAEKQLLEELAKKHPLKEPRVDPSKLHWSPYLSDVKRDKFSIHSKKPTIEDSRRAS